MIIREQRIYDAAWNAVLGTSELSAIRQKMSVHEMRLLIRVIVDAVTEETKND